MELGLGSVLDVLVLKNDAECTSQRLKRTSGARVLIFCFWLLVISYCLHSQNMPGEPPGVAWGNRFPRADLYDFLTLPVRTPQAQLGWGTIATKNIGKYFRDKKNNSSIL